MKPKSLGCAIMSSPKIAVFQTPKQIAAETGCSISKAKDKIRKARADAIAMLIKARRTEKPVKGYTEQQLEQIVIGYNGALGSHD